MSKSNVVLAANVLVHHICHLHQGDGLIPCLFGDQMQLYHMVLITEEPLHTQTTHTHTQTRTMHMYIHMETRAKVSRCVRVNDNICIEQATAFCAIFPPASIFISSSDLAFEI